MRNLALVLVCSQFIDAGAALSAELEMVRTPVPVMIEQLIKSPDDFNGKIVRVQGRITQCAEPQSCRICAEDADGKLTNSCLGIELLEKSVPARDTWKKYRFATVILDGEFNSECLKASPPCLDNATSLFKTRVDSILRRHSVLDVQLEYVFGDLVAASGRDMADMLDAMKRAGLAVGPHEKKAVFRLVNVDPHLGSIGGIAGVGCIGNGTWPTQWAIGANSPGNPFRCWFLRQAATGWSVILDDTAP